MAGYISYTLEFRQAREDVTEKAHVLLSTAMSMRGYTVDEVAPLVRLVGNTSQFHPQMVPSYGAQTMLARLHKDFPDYRYRESSLNPTNIEDRANDWEVGLLQDFRQNKNLHELSGVVGEGAATRFYVSRPIRLTKPECLECHSIPAAAPSTMVAKYGAGNGFNWQLGDVVGMQIVEVPVLPVRAKALSGVLVTVGSLICVFVVTLAIFLLLLRRYVTTPLSTVTRIALSSSLEERPAHGGASGLDGQFHELEQSISRLKTSLDQAMRQFSRHKSGE